MPPVLLSFDPIADARSRVLVLGTMPGPEALRRREYYGFPGNHFWRIMIDLLAPGRTLSYPEKIDLVRRHRIALWDVLAACERIGAADSAIRNAVPTDIPGLLARHPGIRAIFLNGTTAARLFRRFHGGRVALPTFPLPSTSPANAAIRYADKLAQWKAVAQAAANGGAIRGRAAPAARAQP
jgi:TDG/mug DNA glycosylase family protein